MILNKLKALVFYMNGRNMDMNELFFLLFFW